MKLLNKILLLVLLSFMTVVASASYTEKSASGDFLQAQELYQGKSLVKWLSHQEKIKKLGWEASGCCVAPNSNSEISKRLDALKEYKRSKGLGPNDKVSAKDFENFRRGNAGANGKQLYPNKTKYKDPVVESDHGHHSDPKFLGGDPDQKLTNMPAREHRDLHSDLNNFLENKTDSFGNNMRPSSTNKGLDIQENFTRNECLGALCEFYKGDGAKYKDAAEDFFTQHPNLK